MRNPVRATPISILPLTSFRKVFEELLSKADIQVNGERPWDIQVHHDRIYRRILAEGNMGLGESYVEGDWDCGRVDEFICRLLKARLDQAVKNSFKVFLSSLSAKLINFQSKARAAEVAKAHYNLDPELFERMLDKRLLYTCAYWEGAKDLEEAQEKKLDLICRKIGLREGMTVLDLGCGWGSFAKFAAEKYGARLGKSVIWCCRNDHVANLHFDTRQYNHIAWEDEADLKERLVLRTKALGY